MEGVSTTPVWGNGTDYNYYWNGLCSWYKGGADNKRTNGDPYRYIDGPGGGPLDISYQWCCSTGPFTMFSFAQHLMPWMKYVDNDPEIIIYADRVFNGRGIDDFGGGWWGAPDPCAGPDPRECRECAPYKGDNHGCLYYGVTWGPDPAKSGDCIRHTPATYAPVDYRDVEDDNCLKFRGDSTGIGCTHYGETWGRDSVTGEWITVGTDPARQGRFPSLHATANPPTSWGRMSSLVTTMWLHLRDCADPDSPTYPCTGLGAEAPGTGLLDLLQPSGGKSSDGIRVFPNPSTGPVFISGKAEVFHVYDHAGRLVQTVGNHTAHLPQGVYVVCTPDHAAAVRLMVVHGRPL